MGPDHSIATLSLSLSLSGGDCSIIQAETDDHALMKSSGNRTERLVQAGSPTALRD